jgi:hypothetical protein
MFAPVDVRSTLNLVLGQKKTTMQVPSIPPVRPVLRPRPTGLPSDDAVLVLADGTAFYGTSFGAPGKSASGECVFQTGKS